MQNQAGIFEEQDNNKQEFTNQPVSMNTTSPMVEQLEITEVTKL